MPPDVSPDLWRDLAARAATLGERLGGAVHVEPGENELADARLARWREVAANGDPDRFRAVLAAHGLADEAAARPLLAGTARWPSGAPLPGWTRLARRLARGLSPVRHARAVLRRRVGPEIYAGLTRPAHAAMEAHLAARLDEAAADARKVERRVLRAMTGRDLSETAAGSDAWRELFSHYPVLARVVAGLVRDWVATGAEFLRRLHRDRSRLAAAFFAGTDPGPITRLQPGAGDAHRSGRSVLLLEFAGGRRLVYKPRDVHPEQVWANVVERVNAAGFSPTLCAGRVLPHGRGTGAYGWMEWVPSLPRRGPAARRRYGRRAGVLTCLFHVLGGTDGHRQNVVARGEHPVLVDVETLAHPPPPAVPGRTTTAMAAFTHSLLRTLLVPIPGALLPPAADDDPDSRSLWRPPAGFERRSFDDGSPPPVRPVFDVPRRELLAGFRAMARFLVTPAGRRVRAHASRALSGRTVRRVWLPTMLYAELRRRSVSARSLRDGVDRGIELAWLSRVEGTPRTPGDVAVEIRALEGLDIPCFAAPAVSPDDAPWLVADATSLTRHLGEQAALLAEVLFPAGGGVGRAQREPGTTRRSSVRGR